MKNLLSNMSILADFAISNEEMVNVRGGEGEIVKPTIPPVII